MNITPVGAKLLVRPLPKEDEVLDSGIIMPGVANANLMRGEVVAVSSQIKELYKIGDVVLYPEKKGTAQVINQVAHLWLDTEPNLNEVWGIIEQSN